MAINCPICHLDVEGHSDIRIFGHIMIHYGKLIQKIHERIEHYEKQEKKYDLMYVDYIKAELKSLLEDNGNES